jgi:hypothetical protein
MSDVVYLDLRGHEKPAVLLTEAEGGPGFMAQLLVRELFPKEIFNKAVSSSDGGTHCWPPKEK